MKGIRLPLVVMAGVVVLVAGAWGATRSPLLDVDRVTVRGATHTTAPEVLRAMGLDDGGFMTDVDEGSAARRVRALPWVARARVRRHWPGTVVVVVAERAAASVPGRSGRWALVDGSGRVLVEVPGPNPDRPVIEGIPPAGAPGTRLEAPGRSALRVATTLPGTLAARVGAVVLRDGEVELRLRPEPAQPPRTVRLGSDDRLPEKLLATETLLARADLRRLAVIDVRVPASPVIVRHP